VRVGDVIYLHVNAGLDPASHLLFARQPERKVDPDQVPLGDVRRGYFLPLEIHRNDVRSILHRLRKRRGRGIISAASWPAAPPHRPGPGIAARKFTPIDKARRSRRTG
jgi:hypothetical protein